MGDKDLGSRGHPCTDMCWTARAKTRPPRARHPEKLEARAETTSSSAHLFAWFRATQSSDHSHPLAHTSLEHLNQTLQEG